MERFRYYDQFSFEDMDEASHRSAVIISRCIDYLIFVNEIYRIAENKINNNDLKLKAELTDQFKRANDKLQIAGGNLQVLWKKTESFFNLTSEFVERDIRFEGFIRDDDLDYFRENILAVMENEQRSFNMLNQDVEDLFDYLSDMKQEYIYKNLGELAYAWTDKNYEEFFETIDEEINKMEKSNKEFLNALYQKTETNTNKQEKQDDEELAM